MQRHPGLRGLSRDHHHALVLARALRKHAAREASSQAEVASGIHMFQHEWREHVAPHFSIEERELLPLSYGWNELLTAHAATIRADHSALRAMAADLSGNAFASRAVALATRLETHVRFEEQHWFPSLEAVLDANTLAALSWRLQLEPCAPIVDFQPDKSEGAGTWIAKLACGHSQHIRHKPPFQTAAWITSEEARAAKLGTGLTCLLCRMPRLPPKARVYKQTPTFDEQTVPKGLLGAHKLRADTWAQIVVAAGHLDYVIEEPTPLAFVLRPGVEGTVAPECSHHVRLHAGTRFQVHFLRIEPASSSA